MKKVLLEKKYSAEELSDVQRDVSEAFDERMTPEAAGIPKDEHGFEVGVFKVTITWQAECCVPTAQEEALLAAGEYTPEELWGGKEPSCPRCFKK